MPKLYTAKEYENGEFQTVNGVRYSIEETDESFIVYPEGRERLQTFDSQEEFQTAFGLSSYVVPPATPEEIAELAKKAAWDAAAAAFEALPLGKQALWEPIRAKVAAYIEKGDFASAYQTIDTVPSLYSGMSTDKATFLALFQ